MPRAVPRAVPGNSHPRVPSPPKVLLPHLYRTAATLDRSTRTASPRHCRAQAFDGVSLVPLLTPRPSRTWNKSAAFTQYPRRVKQPAQPWDSNSIIHTDRRNFTHMGLSVRTAQWRYTEWLRWDPRRLAPRWDVPAAAAELYDYRNVSAYPTDFNAAEDENVANDTENDAIVHALAAMLRAQFAPAVSQ